MKRLAVLLLTAAVSFAAEFSTGQAARVVIGQTTFTRQDPSSSDVSVGGVSGIAYANGILVVADSNRVGAGPINNRVLIYKNLPNWLFDPTLEVPQTEFGRCPLCGIKADVVLGQPDFSKSDWGTSQTALRTPTAVATDGNILVVSDTDNNRVLIWKSIPTANNAPADIVLGQQQFNTATPNFGTGDPFVPNASSLRGPEGVWLQNGRLFVADDLNNRVLIWNSIPTKNYQPADIVIGQPNFTTGATRELTLPNPSASNLLNPVAVTTDGTRMYVTDLGHNRVLIWNSIPGSNGVAADVVLGQADFTGAENSNANNVTKVCTPTKDANGKDVYPVRCAASLDFPRFALSDGRRLFIADGGNDRVLVYNQIPTHNAAAADAVLGQFDDKNDQNSDSANPGARSSTDSVRAPMSLAFDGTNLYATDPFNRRIMVFTPGDIGLPLTGVRNAASLEIYATGRVAFAGTVAENDEVTITVADKEYKYKAAKTDDLNAIVTALANQINAGPDPNVIANANTFIQAVYLTSRVPGEAGNSISFGVTVTDTSKITAVPNGVTLQGGGNAAKIAPGSLVAIIGDGLTEQTATADPKANPLPTELGNVQVYFDGVRAPLLYVSPKQINAQVPYEVNDANSISAYIRVKRSSGEITITRAVGVPIIPSAPGIFTYGGPTDPRPGVVLHSSSYAMGTISVDGSVKAGDTATVTIEDRQYKYTVQASDTLASIRDALIALINQDPKVEAFAAGAFTRIRLRARTPGPSGNGIQYKGQGAGEVVLSNSNTGLCCANVAYSPVTPDNPAIAGETVLVYATGLGMVQPDQAKWAQVTGYTYQGPTPNDPLQFVYSTAGGKTANVLYAGLRPGDPPGVYEVELELNSDLRSDQQTNLYIAQDIYLSNVITFAVYNPNPPQPATQP